jgi:hypothetical protein
MAKKTRIVWQKPLTNITNGMQKYGKRALVAVRAVGEYVGAHMQNEARQNAPWEDRTGNARGGLFYVVDGFGKETEQGAVEKKTQPQFDQNLAKDTGDGGSENKLVIVLAHAMGYGAILETGHGERYAIIMPTIEAAIPMLQRMMTGILEKSQPAGE